MKKHLIKMAILIATVFIISQPIILHAEETQTSATYIDVNIQTQTLTYFVEGNPVLITPCVTGKPGNSTPKGVFAINTCVPGKYLNGPTWHVWVDRWMRFSGNCGIHDATWRYRKTICGSSRNAPVAKRHDDNRQGRGNRQHSG